MRMSRITPMLPVSSMPASVQFYEKLGFSVEKRNDEWRWAMLRFGDCRLMVDESINVRPGPPATVVYMYLDDIAAFHGLLRANGLAVPELDLTFYGMREFRMTDPDGNRLWIGEETSTSQT